MNSTRKILLVSSIAFFLLVSLFSNEYNPFYGCSEKKDSVDMWQYPDINSVSDTEEGKLIKYGFELISNTSRYIGNFAVDTNMRYAGNMLNCQNCHFDAGREKNALGLVGLYKNFPKFSARVGEKISIETRVNFCMERSMNGKSLPVDSREMKAFVAYLKFLSSDIPPGLKIEGQGLRSKMPLLDRPADPEEGKTVYLENCTTCHAEGGNGVPNDMSDPSQGYDFPPVWGSESFNNGAGMNRLLTAANFIKSKMPRHDTRLTDEQAYDVAAYINSQPRPEAKGLQKDYPDLKLKPIDCPYPPYADDFSERQHKYGPYIEMMQEK